MTILLNRFATKVPTEWGFTVTCVALRLCEGVGTAILTTAIFSTFPHLYPKSVGTLVVSGTSDLT